MNWNKTTRYAVYRAYPMGNNLIQELVVNRNFQANILHTSADADLVAGILNDQRKPEEIDNGVLFVSRAVYVHRLSVTMRNES